MASRKSTIPQVGQKNAGKPSALSSPRGKTAYELSESQVSTPPSVVRLFWDIVKQRRPKLDSVLDLGAGDCRFAPGGHFSTYVGLEIDADRIQKENVPLNGRVINECAFSHKPAEYDACIGNPPYVRHHDIESPWKENTAKWIQDKSGIKLHLNCNLYLYFLTLGIIKTKDSGILSMIIPYEWVSRPSAKPIRDYLRKQKWDVDIYKFNMPIFDGVLTTASVSIIDKSKRTGIWRFYDVNQNHFIEHRNGISDGLDGIIKYEKRSDIWAMRGLSPGSQKIFVLTEEERIKNGLEKKDVVPCITTLKYMPSSARHLNQKSFKKHFILANRRCWLIRSFRKKRSRQLNLYLKSIPKELRDNYTCNHQKPWFNFSPHPTPKLLVSSGFTKFGPKVLANEIKACAAGSVLGVHGDKISSRSAARIQKHLLNFCFEERVVAHAKSLKKIEVKQLNAVLNGFVSTRRTK